MVRIRKMKENKYDKKIDKLKVEYKQHATFGGLFGLITATLGLAFADMITAPPSYASDLLKIGYLISTGILGTLSAKYAVNEISELFKVSRKIKNLEEMTKE